jgi:glucan phosphoethanolaminetransferase (alkaline phosphatase superfamily)
MVSFIPLYFLNAGDNNFLNPFTTFVQKTSSLPLKLPIILPLLVIFRLSFVFRLWVFLGARFLAVVVFFFALGILFSYALCNVNLFLGVHFLNAVSIS